MRNNHYNKSLKYKARSLRKDPTKAEVKLWHEVLQGRRCMGHRFLRQRPIDNFIVDFFSKDLQLVIEVDGYTHQFEEVSERDEYKDGRLSELGYAVLRFTDDEVMNDLNNVVRTLEHFILDFEESSKDRDPSPPLSPSRGKLPEERFSKSPLRGSTTPSSPSRGQGGDKNTST